MRNYRRARLAQPFVLVYAARIHLDSFPPSSPSFLPSPPVLIISHWNYYNLIRYHPSPRPSLAPYCKPTAIIRRVCSLRRRVISRLIYIYIYIPRILLFVTHSVTHLYNVATIRLPYSSLAQRCAGRASRPVSASADATPRETCLCPQPDHPD